MIYKGKMRFQTHFLRKIGTKSTLELVEYLTETYY